MDKTHVFRVIQKQKIRKEREQNKPYIIDFKDENMSIIFVCCITENLIKIISAQLKNDSLPTSVVICAYSESIEGAESKLSSA